VSCKNAEEKKKKKKKKKKKYWQTFIASLTCSSRGLWRMPERGLSGASGGEEGSVALRATTEEEVRLRSDTNKPVPRRSRFASSSFFRLCRGEDAARERERKISKQNKTTNTTQSFFYSKTLSLDEERPSTSQVF
jgi:hypothetical protein